MKQQRVRYAAAGEIEIDSFEVKSKLREGKDGRNKLRAYVVFRFL